MILFYWWCGLPTSILHVVTVPAHGIIPARHDHAQQPKFFSVLRELYRRGNALRGAEKSEPFPASEKIGLYDPRNVLGDPDEV